MKSLGECLRAAIPLGPIIGERVRMSRAEFDALRLAIDPCNLPTAPEVDCKVLIDGKWHTCQRQYQMGQSIHFASPITIVLNQEEAHA